ncbi:putative oxidoreductase [Pseudozyma hubeiensis]|nr:putative oxidoreductase [Pseudozyma hubeiensis]
MSDNNSPVVLLTGASRGLGLAILKLLLRGSPSTSSATFPAARVVTVSRTITPELADLQTAHPDSLLCVQGDVTSSSKNSSAVSAAVREFGGLDSVILNAGVVSTELISNLTPESFAETLNVNTVSLITTLTAALPELRKSTRGTVVFVSSGAATGNTAGWCAYNASKAALNAVARTLANEEDQLAVFSVRPGVVDTDMQSLLRSEKGQAMKKDERERFLTLHKEGKLLRPEQPAASIAALAVKGTRSEPKGKDGEGLGKQGAFVTWNEDVLAGYKDEDIRL